MRGAINDRHIDSEPFAYGTHTGPNNSADLVRNGADFKSCGIQAGVLIKNTTMGTSGTISSVSEDRVVADLGGGVITPLIDSNGEIVYDRDGTIRYMQPEEGSVGNWNRGDEYEIYLTATEDSFISSTFTDKRFGRMHRKKNLFSGIAYQDIDADEFKSQRNAPR